MEITFAYKNATTTIELTEPATLDTFAPAVAASPVMPADLPAICKTGGAESVLSAERPLVIVNDGYRPTPTARVLAWLNDDYPDFLDRAEFLIATGTHAAPTESHLKFIFGEQLDRVRSRVQYHDCRDLPSLVEIGRDRFNQPVLVNRLLFDFKDVLVIGSVEPHYFAGLTGGRKSIFPGLCDLATTERNHNLANSLEARPLRTKGNPVSDHFDELMQLLPGSPPVSIQLVTDAHGDIAAATCGRLDRAFAEAAGEAVDIYAHTIDEPFDTVLCELQPPLDGNLYQAQKALENCRGGVRKGGSIVVLSACEEGVGSPHFYEQAKAWNIDKNEPGDGVFRFGSHKLSRVNAMRREIDVRLYSEVAPEAARQVFYEPIDDLQRYLNHRARAIPDFRVALVRDAGHVVLTSGNN